MFKTKQMKETVLAYSRLFDTKDGKMVLDDLVKSCHILNSTVDSTPHETYFNEGARSVVLRILKTTHVNMDNLNALIERAEKQEEQYE